MNEENKKIIEQANQTGALMQSITNKLKESDNPQKDGIGLLNKIGEWSQLKIKTIIFEFLDDIAIEYPSTSKEDLIAIGHAESKIDLIDKIAGQLAQTITTQMKVTDENGKSTI